MNSEFTYDVFLSYNSKDKAVVGELAKRLRDTGLRVWFDEWVIQPGCDIGAEIEVGLEKARTLLLLMSAAAFDSDWVKLERNTTLFRDPVNQKRRFIPVLLEDCDIPDTLRRYKYVDWRHQHKSAFEELLKACQKTESLKESSRGRPDTSTNTITDSIDKEIHNAVFLLGYPLGIIATSISLDYFYSVCKGLELEKLQNLFITSYSKTIDINYDHVFEYDTSLIENIKANQNSNKPIEALKEIDYEECLMIKHLRQNNLIAQLASKVAELHGFSKSRDKEMFLFIMSSCLRLYELAFYSEMTIKEDIPLLIKLIEKVESTIVTKHDIYSLRTFLYQQLNKKKMSAKIHGTLFNETIDEIIINETGFPESEYFSDPIIAHMAVLKKDIENMTSEQLHVLEYVRYNKRVLIGGCAGSGKTLLAAEKAVRLDSAGIKTLILCHNPFLATHIKHLVESTGVDVFDIKAWLDKILGRKVENTISWSEFDEPFESDVEDAFEKIMSLPSSYDAIIVDEAQDFTELWWLLIEAELEKSKEKILYIFYDDNQSLLPFRSKYPIKKSPISMSKNCRNAGEIFEIVKRFHYQAPKTSFLLKDRGIFKLTKYKTTENFENHLASAIRDAFRYAPKSQIIVLSAEPHIIEKSALAKFKFVADTNKLWHTVAYGHLVEIKEHLKLCIKKLRTIDPVEKKMFIHDEKIRPQIDYYSEQWDLPIPVLEGNIYPTDKDKDNVRKFAMTVMNAFTYKPLKSSDSLEWILSDDRLTIGGFGYENDAVAKLRFYSSKLWHDVPEFPTISLSYNDLNSRFEDDKIPLFSTSSFKGLEADAIVLFTNSRSNLLFPRMYVGSSRAHGYLHMVINDDTLLALPSLAM